MRRELDGGVESVRPRIVDPEALDGRQVELESRLALRELAPELGDPRRVRELVDPVDEQEGSVIDA